MKPTRWLQTELPEELRDALQDAVDEPLNAQQLARVRGKLGAALGPAFAPLQVAPQHPLNVRLALWSKALGLVAVAGLGALLWSQPRAAEPRRSSAPRAADVVPASAARAQLQEQPPAATEPQVPALPPQPAAAAASSTRKPAAREPGLAEELQQLEAIRVELVRSPKRALAAARLHERRFPHGALVPERELLKLEAWLRLGERERAQRLAEHALAAHGGQPYRTQVLALLQRYEPATAVLTQH